MIQMAESGSGRREISFTHAHTYEYTYVNVEDESCFSLNLFKFYITSKFLKYYLLQTKFILIYIWITISFIYSI